MDEILLRNAIVLLLHSYRAVKTEDDVHNGTVVTYSGLTFAAASALAGDRGREGAEGGPRLAFALALAYGMVYIQLRRYRK